MTTDIAETPHIPRRREWSFYIVLLAFVLPIWSVTPLSWTFVLYSLTSGRLWSFAWAGRLCFLAAFCESVFSAYQFILARRISGPSPCPPGNMIDLQKAFKRVLQAGLATLPHDSVDEETLDINRPGSPAEVIERLEYDDPRAIDFRARLRTWFGMAPWSALRTQQIYEWLFWAIFNAHIPPLDTLTRAQRTALDEAVEMLEKRAGAAIPEGSNPNIKPMRPTIDPVNFCLRPLAWYIFVKLGNIALMHWCESRHGFRYECYRGFEYLIRIPPGYSRMTGPDPCVFFHGLGLGLLQYQHVLYDIIKELPDQPLLIPLQPHISQDIFHPRYLNPMGRFETVDNLFALLQGLGWVGEDVKDKGITLLSHSNGSYAHGWMLKSHSDLVKRSCFVDPVTFCSWEGDVCHNFLYQPCANGVELVMRYFVGTELGVVNLLQRHFDWAGNLLWYEEIPFARDPSRTMFFVAGNDAIVDAKRVKRYLTSHGIKKGLVFDPDGRHGQALITGGKGLAEVKRWLRGKCPS